jgi:hypothetical protein
MPFTVVAKLAPPLLCQWSVPVVSVSLTAYLSLEPAGKVPRLQFQKSLLSCAIRKARDLDCQVVPLSED